MAFGEKLQEVRKQSGMTQDIAGMDLELALSALSEVDARGVSADITDAIFHRFCVGK